MGTVHFTQGHHGLYSADGNPDINRWFLFTEDLTNIAVVRDRNGTTVRDSYSKMIRAALRALRSLGDFNAAVSLIYDQTEVGERLLIPHRTWGEISFGSPSNVIVRFSHDSRKVNEPFVSLYQWLEDLCPPRGVDDETFFEFEDKWSDPLKWKHFFMGRIKKKISKMRSDANKLREDAVALDSVANNVSNALKSIK